MPNPGFNADIEIFLRLLIANSSQTEERVEKVGDVGDVGDVGGGGGEWGGVILRMSGLRLNMTGKFPA